LFFYDQEEKLLIKRIFLILFAGMFLWAGTACAPRPLRSAGAAPEWEIQTPDRSAIPQDAGDRRNSPPDAPPTDTAKQITPPRRTAPALARTPNKPAAGQPGQASPPSPPGQPIYGEIAPDAAPGQPIHGEIAPDAAPEQQAEGAPAFMFAPRRGVRRLPQTAQPANSTPAGALFPATVQHAPQTLPPADPQAPRKGQYTLNFDDADIYAIIQTVFGEILKVNYVVDPRVKGRVTFRAVAPVPAENVLPLMEVILRLNGVGIVEDGGLYRIVPISDISKEPSPVSYGRNPEEIKTTGKALLQVVPILHVPSTEALKLITPFASSNAVLIDVPKGNQIILVDTDANVKRMLKLIEIFDNEKLKQRKPQLFVYQVQNGKAKDIATLLQQIFMGGKEAAPERTPAAGGAFQSRAPAPTPASDGAPAPSPSKPAAIPAGDGVIVAESVKIIADEITNTIVVLSTPEDYATVAKAVEQLDIVPRQVVIEAMIASVSLTDNLSLGMAALFKGSLSNYNIGVGVNPGGLNVNPAALTQAGFTFLVTDAAGLVRGLLTALATESRAKVLAAPHILVSDNREAKIQVGQQVPLITSETYGVAGVAPQRNYSYRDIGIILKVKPRINEGGLVSIEIAQEISTYEKISVGGTDQLLLNKTDAATNLVVQDGQTIVIGGLIREDTTKSASGIPFLSSIPIIGWLFGGTEDEKKRQELIILLTPRVIKNQKEAKALSRELIDEITESTQGRIKGEELLKERAPRGNEAVHPGNASEKTTQP
jgi:type II secretory pathway component GspD/PulD (secretin)